MPCLFHALTGEPMNAKSIFISHATKDDDFVAELRQKLEGQGLSVWVDSRQLRGGDKLAPALDAAIENARQVIVVLSANTINSPWVRQEIQKALEVEKRRQKEGYRVIPLLPFYDKLVKRQEKQH